MTAATRKPRIAIVSPFLDKNHGTERRVTEWVSQLADNFEIHIYSQRGGGCRRPKKYTLHRILQVAWDLIFANFIWWFVANRLCREWDRRIRGIKYDLVFSPGPNCLDADVFSGAPLIASRNMFANIASGAGHRPQAKCVVVGAEAFIKNCITNSL